MFDGGKSGWSEHFWFLDCKAGGCLLKAAGRIAKGVAIAIGLY